MCNIGTTIKPSQITNNISVYTRENCIGITSREEPEMKQKLTK
jgi:hypothetical protein